MCNPFLILNKWCIFASGKNFPYIVIIAQCIVFFVRTVAVYREPLQFNCFWEVYQLEELTERVRRFIIIPLEPDSSLVFHTDRGSNYRSKTMNDYMRSLNITHSFSRAHVPYDNSVMESFFASMKREELYRTKYRSESDFRSAVDKYMIFYNTKRPHKKLQYKTPEQKEEEYALKLKDF